MRVKSGAGKSFDTPEEIEKWIADRKKAYPSAANLLKKHADLRNNVKGSKNDRKNAKRSSDSENLESFIKRIKTKESIENKQSNESQESIESLELSESKTDLDEISVPKAILNEILANTFTTLFPNVENMDLEDGECSTNYSGSCCESNNDSSDESSSESESESEAKKKPFKGKENDNKNRNDNQNQDQNGKKGKGRICKFYQLGSCKKGLECGFRHEETHDSQKSKPNTSSTSGKFQNTRGNGRGRGRGGRGGNNSNTRQSAPARQNLLRMVIIFYFQLIN